MTYLDTDRQTQADLSITEGIYDEYPLYFFILRNGD